MFTFSTIFSRTGKFQILATRRKARSTRSRYGRVGFSSPKTEEAHQMFVGGVGPRSHVRSNDGALKEKREDVRKVGGIDFFYPDDSKVIEPLVRGFLSLDLFGSEVSVERSVSSQTTEGARRKGVVVRRFNLEIEGAFTDRAKGARRRGKWPMRESE